MHSNIILCRIIMEGLRRNRENSPGIVSQVMSEDEGVLVSLREGLLQCVSWVAIQQYLSRGRLTSRVNWLSIIHTLVSKLQGAALSELTETLNTLVSLLVRVRLCECGGNPLIALEDLVPLLSKIERFPELKDDVEMVQDIIVQAKCQIVLYHYGFGDDRQAIEIWDLYFRKIHESPPNRHWKLADRLKRVIPSNQMLDPTSSNFSVEKFLTAHSIETFCENAWMLADHVVNNRLKEPRMFEKWKNEGNLLDALTENLSHQDERNYLNQQSELDDQSEQNDLNQADGLDDLSQQNELGQPGGLDECLVISETPILEQEEEQREEQQHTASSEASSSKALKKPPPHDGPGDEEDIEIDDVQKPPLREPSKDPNPGPSKVVKENINDDADEIVQWSDDSSIASTPPSRLPARLPPAYMYFHSPLVTHKPVPKSRRGKVARRPKVYWTSKEEDYVREGVRRFGFGKWREILDAYPFKPCRTSGDIRDKWRNCH